LKTASCALARTPLRSLTIDKPDGALGGLAGTPNRGEEWVDVPYVEDGFRGQHRRPDDAVTNDQWTRTLHPA